MACKTLALSETLRRGTSPAPYSDPRRSVVTFEQSRRSAATGRQGARGAPVVLHPNVPRPALAMNVPAARGGRTGGPRARDGNPPARERTDDAPRRRDWSRRGARPAVRTVWNTAAGDGGGRAREVPQGRRGAERAGRRVAGAAAPAAAAAAPAPPPRRRRNRATTTTRTTTTTTSRPPKLPSRFRRRAARRQTRCAAPATRRSGRHKELPRRSA